ncbi:MAG: SDR family oxidoreductase [Chitinispirillaceae bacterium]|nr:SDR family oxidoreductase [Chitinispirillaceae bacterium]
MNPSVFNNKTIWITGASSGIGEALTTELATTGARLVVSARNAADLDNVASRCRERNAKVTIFVEPFDVAEHHLFPAVVKRVLDRTGGIDILISNAGVGQRGSALSSNPDVVRRIFDVNFFGAVFLTQGLLPSMLERKSGRIVVISSVLGKFHLPGRSAYAASKHALQGYFDTLRAEIAGTGVEISIIRPGWIETPMSRNALTADGVSYGKSTKALSRKMSPEECARRILHVVAAGKNDAAIGGIEKWGGVLRILFPRAYDRIMGKKMSEFIYKIT